MEALELLINQGADINKKSTKEKYDKSQYKKNDEQWTPLQRAVHKDDLPIVKLLLSNPNLIIEPEDLSPLCMAVQKQNFSMCQLFFPRFSQYLNLLSKSDYYPFYYKTVVNCPLEYIAHDTIGLNNYVHKKPYKGQSHNSYISTCLSKITHEAPLHRACIKDRILYFIFNYFYFFLFYFFILFFYFFY